MNEAENIINEIKEKLIDTINPKAIILFGSTAKNDNDENSDIDLLIIWDGVEDLNNVQRRIKLREIIGFVNKPLDILTYTSDELKQVIKDDRSFTATIIKEGKIIYGGFN
ncbi:nucleotidyltransferase domain-containing protein [Thermoanaerobacter uzonensis]|nr:nucleotidyltransferase domain-containing protein [Clostridia bacterium]